MTSYLVSTDLDGTLLDHHTYSWAEAKPALSQLKHKNIPVVINTSKTAEEVQALQGELAIRDPFIVENGSAVFIHPDDQRFACDDCENTDGYNVKILGCKRKEITDFLESLRDTTEYSFSTFSDYSVEEIIELTGLPKPSAASAKNRFFSEPLVWKDTDQNYEAFYEQVVKAGYKILKGGRFIHVLGKTNKGSAATWLVENMLSELKPRLIALGDSHNDIDMLAMADIAIWCKSPTNAFPPLEHPHLIKTLECGPLGWNTSILEIVR